MKKTLVLTAILALTFGSANAISFAFGPGNAGMTGGYYTISGTTVDIYEDWTLAGMGVLIVDQLEQGVDYTITKHINNSTGIDWDHMALELLDPGVDANDVAPQPAWVPAGYSTSTEFDGLSFAQGSGIPRVSNVFTSLITDEFAGHDYLDFYGGVVSGAGGTVDISFGLRDNGANQPFLLAQRPNEYTGSAPGVPEPTTMLLFGLGLAGVAIRKRFQK